jgi:hypothetical protein
LIPAARLLRRGDLHARRLNIPTPVGALRRP